MGQAYDGSGNKHKLPQKKVSESRFTAKGRRNREVRKVTQSPKGKGWGR